MPGLKRKTASSSSSTPSGSAAKRKNGATGNGNLNGKAKLTSDVESDRDDFDDDEDLMAAALTGAGADEEEFSDEEEDEDDFDDDNNFSGDGEMKGDLGGEDDTNGQIEMLSDEDMDGGFEDVSGQDINTEVGKSSKTSSAHPSLYAIPSRDEMSSLKNTSELYKSNIFKLKIEEMLNEVRPKYEKSGALDYVLRQIKNLMESVPSIEAQPLKSALDALSRTFKVKSIKVPFPDPQPKQDSPIKFAFQKPSRVQVVGSWILKTASLRPEGVDVDLVLTMPSSLFQEKDHLNMRYFHKRAYYLAAVAAALEGEDGLGVECQFALQEEDPRRPYLILKAKHNSSQSDFTKLKTFIKIHLAHEENLFPSRRLSPSRNNVRMDGIEEGEQPATPSYNASVLADSLFASHLIYLNATSQSSASFAEACMLLKTWSLQRMFGAGPNKAEIKGKIGKDKGRRIGLGSSNIRFILSMILAHLLQGPEKTGASNSNAKSRLSPAFSSYQLFKGVIDFLASQDFHSQPVFMKGIDGLLSRRDKIDAEEFTLHSESVLVDPTGSTNLLQNIHKGTFEHLQAEAKVTLAMLNDAQNDHFDEIFLQDRSKPSFQFDEVIKLDLKSISGNPVTNANLGSPLKSSAFHLYQTLKQALNTRSILITFFVPSNVLYWPSSSSRPKVSQKVEIGIMYNASQAFRLVDHGPRPEDQSASEAFKAFWGDLAELRRFRDGRIVESVVWSINGPLDRPSIPRQIIRHILGHHYNLHDDNQFTFHSEAFQNLLSPDEDLAKLAYLSMPSEAGFQTIYNAFDEVVKALRGLEGLPLSLISVVGADAGLRSMSPMVPCPLNINATLPGSSSFLPVHDFVITLESSGRWPDDLVAIQAMKMAFYETMATKLTSSLSSCKTAIVALDVDADQNDYWDCSALEVVLTSGLAFRGRIYHERERVLLHRILDDKDEEGYTKSQAKIALDRFETRFEHNVRHHNHMAALFHRFNSLGEAVRLFKRWVSSQMLAMDVPEHLCELLVASVYITASEGGLVPSVGHTGFIQTLQMLSNWDWRQEPLGIALTGSTSSVPVTQFSAEAKATLESNFDKIRRLDPGLNNFAWFIATESELKGSCWAKRHPSATTADALQRLARGACDILAAGCNLSRESVKSLFVPSFGHFDFLIHLEPETINRYLDHVSFNNEELEKSQARVSIGKEKSNSKSKYRNFSLSSSSSSLQAGLDVGKEFVSLLESLYLDTMRLYYDDVGGIVIGGLFNPFLSKPRTFRVGLGFNSQTVDGKTKEVVLNRGDVLAEIERLGKGIVRKVEWKGKD